MYYANEYAMILGRNSSEIMAYFLCFRFAQKKKFPVDKTEHMYYDERMANACSKMNIKESNYG
ncbi:hypothetical protein K280104A7_16010 [Candidatus Bariatricus faecipullorum]